MGYLSNGSIYLSEEAQGLLPSDLKEHLREYWKVDIENINVWSFEDFKWSMNKDDIMRWEKFMETLESDDIDFDFVRVGASQTDIEVRTGKHFSINIEWEVF